MSVNTSTSRLRPSHGALSAALHLAAACCMTLCVNAATYYISPSGNNSTGDGSPTKPWSTIAYGISRSSPGDTLYLEAGALFTENVYFGPDDGGTALAPVTLTSSSTNRARLQPPNNNAEGILIWNTGGVRIENIIVIGPGTNNTEKTGVAAMAANGRFASLTFRNLDVSAYKSGLTILGWGSATNGFYNVLIENCSLHHNRAGGGFTWAESIGGISNIIVRGSRFYSNYGDPAATANTGNGFVMGSVIYGLIEYCTAFDNGGQGATATEGPVGLWSYDSTAVTIQFCESYSNHAQRGAVDGGGFDLDGGCQNCLIQYCYSHDNDGAGFLICQYTGARAFLNNTVRYCISENDGRKNNYGGITFWSSGSNGGLQNTKIYHNTIYNAYNFAINRGTGTQTGTKVWNNIFVTTNGRPLVKDDPTTSVQHYQGNVYWSSGATFTVAGFSSLEAWRAARNQEMLGSRAVGLRCDPRLLNPGAGGTIGDPYQLCSLHAYRLHGSSPLIDRALDLATLFGIAVGSNDFFGASLPQCRTFDVGAHESRDADGDGIPDDWELLFFPTTNVANASSHSDSDGLSDRDESEAGTDPTNALSCLAISSVNVITPGTAVFSWPSADGRRYAVNYSSNLLSSVAQELANGILATPPLNVHTCQFHLSSQAFFFITLER